MKSIKLICLIAVVSFFQCKKSTPEPEETKLEIPDFSSVSQVESGKPVSVMLTSYSTTLIANGKDKTRMRIAVTDSLGREITSAQDSIRLYVTGTGTLKTADEKDFTFAVDSTGTQYAKAKLENGIFNLHFIAGNEPDKVKVEAKSGTLWPGAHEIHTIPSDFIYKTPTENQLPKTTKPIDRMIGADISFLPQLENRGMKFTENGEEVDAIDLLKKHGFNYIRLRIFVNPENEKGYSPKDGFCNLNHTRGVWRPADRPHVRAPHRADRTGCDPLFRGGSRFRRAAGRHLDPSAGAGERAGPARPAELQLRWDRRRRRRKLPTARPPMRG
jgi:beta-galactosidase